MQSSTAPGEFATDHPNPLPIAASLPGPAVSTTAPETSTAPGTSQNALPSPPPPPASALTSAQPPAFPQPSFETGLGTRQVESRSANVFSPTAGGAAPSSAPREPKAPHSERGHHPTPPLTLLEHELDLHRRYTGESKSKCHAAVRQVGLRLVAPTGARAAAPGEFRQSFIDDLNHARQVIVERATRVALELAMCQSDGSVVEIDADMIAAPEWTVAGIASLHTHVVNFEFVAKIVGGTESDIMMLYDCKLDDKAAAKVRARLAEFNQQFVTGVLDQKLVEAYFAQMGGRMPCPTSHVDRFPLYVYTLAHGGYNAQQFVTVFNRLGQESVPNSNPTYLRALYRALLYPYEIQHVGHPNFYTPPSRPSITPARGTRQNGNAGGESLPPLVPKVSTNDGGQPAKSPVAGDEVISVASSTASNGDAVTVRPALRADGSGVSIDAGLNIQAGGGTPTAPSASAVVPQAPAARARGLATREPAGAENALGSKSKSAQQGSASQNASPSPSLSLTREATAGSQQHTQVALPKAVHDKSFVEGLLQAQFQTGIQAQPVGPNTSILATAQRSPASGGLERAENSAIVRNFKQISSLNSQHAAAPVNGNAVVSTPSLNPAAHFQGQRHSDAIGQTPLQPRLPLQGQGSVGARAVEITPAQQAQALSHALSLPQALALAHTRAQHSPPAHVYSKHHYQHQQQQQAQAQAQLGSFNVMQRHSAFESQTFPGSRIVRHGTGPLDGQTTFVAQGQGMARAPVPAKIFASNAQAPARTHVQHTGPLSHVSQLQQIADLHAQARRAQDAKAQTGDGENPSSQVLGKRSFARLTSNATPANRAIPVVGQLPVIRPSPPNLPYRAPLAQAPHVASANLNPALQASVNIGPYRSVNPTLAAAQAAQAQMSKSWAAVEASKKQKIAHAAATVDAERRQREAAKAAATEASKKYKEAAMLAQKKFLMDLRARQARSQLQTIRTLTFVEPPPPTVAAVMTADSVIEEPPPFTGDGTSKLLMDLMWSEAKNVLKDKEHLLTVDRQAACSNVACAAGLTLVSAAAVTAPQTDTPGTASKLRQDFFSDLRHFLMETHGAKRSGFVLNSTIDLFELFLAVLRNGGWYGVMSRNQFDLIAEELGCRTKSSIESVGPTYVWLLSSYENRFVDHCILEAPLMRAAKRGDVTRAAMLLGYGARIDEQDKEGNTALHAAAHKSCLMMAEHLLSRNASVDVVNDAGISPLCLACARGHDTVAELLLMCGADPYIVSSEGNTAMYYSIHREQFGSCRVLLDNGVSASSRVQPSAQLTALHVASARGNVKIAEMLIERGAAVNAVDNSRRAPLHFAVYFGHIAMAMLLIRKGSDCSMKTLRGFTPGAIACSKGFHALGALLVGLEKLLEAEM